MGPFIGDDGLLLAGVGDAVESKAISRFEAPTDRESALRADPDRAPSELRSKCSDNVRTLSGLPLAFAEARGEDVGVGTSVAAGEGEAERAPAAAGPMGWLIEELGTASRRAPPPARMDIRPMALTIIAKATPRVSAARFRCTIADRGEPMTFGSVETTASGV
jgi:hypothetical protein